MAGNENSRVTVDVTANTSDFSKGVEKVTKLLDDANNAVDRITQAGKRPIYSDRAIKSVTDMLNGLKKAQDDVNKVNLRYARTSERKQASNGGNRRSSSVRSKNANNVVRESAMGISPSKQRELNDKITRFERQLDTQLKEYTSASRVVTGGALIRGKIRTNQTFSEYQTETSQNRRGRLERDRVTLGTQQRRNFMTQADRSIRDINDNNGRITAQSRRSYDRKLTSIGTYLDFEGNQDFNNAGSAYKGMSRTRREAVENRDRFSQSQQRNMDRINTLEAKGDSRSFDENAELGRLKKDVQEATKALEEMDKEIESIANLETKFRELQGAESGIREVTPSRRSAYMTYAGIGAVRNMTSQGESILQAQQADTRSLTAANGSYNSFAMRRMAEHSGMGLGISGSEMLSAENAYIQGAGYQSDADTTLAGRRTGILAKVTGATMQDSTSLTSTYASSVNGANANSLTQFQQTFEGALDKSGMVKNGASQLKAMNKLLSTVASQNGGSLSKEQANNLANLQGLAASTGDKALMGENGANALANINSAVTQGGQDPLLRMSLMQQNPGKYSNGLEGWANQQYAFAQGLGNKDVQNAVFSSNSPLGGAGQKALSAMLAQRTGVTPQVMEKLRKQYQKNGGRLSSKELRDAGVTSENGKLATQQSSTSEGKVDKNNASQEAASTQLGQWTTAIKANVGASIASTLGLTQFNTALRVATAAIGSAGPLVAGRKVASAINGVTTSKSEFSTTAGMSWADRAKAKVNTGGGRAGNWFRNTAVGSKVTADANTLLSSAPVMATTKATKAIANSSKLATATRIGTKLTEGAVGITSRVMPFLPAAVDGFSALTQKGNKGANTGGMIGSLLGIGIGSLGGPMGMMLGSMAGEGIGKWLGGKFDGNSQAKSEQSLEQKKKDNEDKRAKNIKADSALTDKQLRLTDKGGKNSDGSKGTRKASGSKSASPYSGSVGSISPYDEAIQTTNKGDAVVASASTKASGSKKQAQQATVVISGTLNHTGNVVDASQVQVSTENWLTNLLTTPQANETRRA